MITKIKDFRKICPRAKWRMGEKYGRLEIIGFDHKCKTGYYWFVLCDCGNRSSVQYGNLRSKDTVSCGCYNKQLLSAYNKKRHGCNIINHNYFNRYSEKNCYMAGLLASDGNIEYRNSDSWRIILTLVDYDKHILKWVKQNVKYRRKIYYKNMQKYNKNSHNQLSLRFCSVKIAKDLMQRFYIYCRKGRSDSPIAKVQGVFSPKPTQLAFPPLKEKLHILSYIMGYFDGDGCLCWSNITQRWSVSFAGNQSFVIEIAKYLYIFNIMPTLKEPYQIHMKKYLNNTTYQLTYGAQSDVKSFMESKQKYSPYHFPRKIYSQAYRDHRQYLADWDLKYSNKTEKQRTKPVVILPGSEKKFYCF